MLFSVESNSFISTPIFSFRTSLRTWWWWRCWWWCWWQYWWWWSRIMKMMMQLMNNYVKDGNGSLLVFKRSRIKLFVTGGFLKVIIKIWRKKYRISFNLMRGQLHLRGQVHSHLTDTIHYKVTLVSFVWPFCVFKCVFKLPAWKVEKSHWMHLFDFSPVCIFKCCLKLPAWEDA